MGRGNSDDSRVRTRRNGAGAHGDLGRVLPLRSARPGRGRRNKDIVMCMPATIAPIIYREIFARREEPKDQRDPEQAEVEAAVLRAQADDAFRREVTRRMASWNDLSEGGHARNSLAPERMA